MRAPGAPCVISLHCEGGIAGSATGFEARNTVEQQCGVVNCFKDCYQPGNMFNMILKHCT